MLVRRLKLCRHDRYHPQDTHASICASAKPTPTVVRLLYGGLMSVGFRPTEEDLRIVEANRRQDEKTSDVIRRALRLLDREAWETRAREDMHRLRNEDLSAEPDAWGYDTNGNIVITGTNLAVPARSQDQP